MIEITGGKRHAPEGMAQRMLESVLDGMGAPGGKGNPTLWIVDAQAFPYGWKAEEEIFRSGNPAVFILSPDCRLSPRVRRLAMDVNLGGVPVILLGDGGREEKEARAASRDDLSYGALSLREDGREWALAQAGRLIRHLDGVGCGASVMIASEDGACRAVAGIFSGEGRKVKVVTGRPEGSWEPMAGGAFRGQGGIR